MLALSWSFLHWRKPMMPLSFAPQNLSQTINPWSMWMQPGLINVNFMNTRAPELEYKMVRDGASYGSQLGRITDLLETMVARLGLEKDRALDASQQSTVQDFLKLARRMRAIKDASPSGARLRVQVMVDELRSLAQTDPATYTQLRGELQRDLPVTARTRAATRKKLGRV
jgi:hypothetical protein